MATLSDSLSDYRELNKPLRRSMRSWWKGPGRLWLVAIVITGLIPGITSAIFTAVPLSGLPQQLLVTVWSLARPAMLPLVLSAWLLVALRRAELLDNLADLAVFANRADARRIYFHNMLFQGAGFLLAYLLTRLVSAVLYAIQQASMGKLASDAMASQITTLLPEALILLVTGILVVSILSATRSRALAWSLLGIFNLHALLWLMALLPGSGRRFDMLDYKQVEFPLLAMAGSMLILGLLAGAIAGSYFRRWLPLAAIAVLAMLRLLELIASQAAGPGMAGLSSVLTPLTDSILGMRAVYLEAPFTYHMHTFNFVDHAEGAMALQVFWNQGLAIRMGGIGYLLALLLNLAWLATVFLFCRWAVGRSAGRSEE